MVGLLVGSVVVVVEQKEEDEAQEVKLLDFNLMIFFKGQKLTKKSFWSLLLFDLLTFVLWTVWLIFDPEVASTINK